MATTQIKSGSSDFQADVNSSNQLEVTDTTSQALLQEIVTNTSGGVTPGSEGFSTITPGFPTQINVGTNSTQLFAANPSRLYGHIFNNSAQPIYIQYQVSAALYQGIKINQGTFFTLELDNLWLGIVNAIGFIPNQLIDVLEGTK